MLGQGDRGRLVGGWLDCLLRWFVWFLVTSFSLWFSILIVIVARRTKYHIDLWHHKVVLIHFKSNVHTRSKNTGVNTRSKNHDDAVSVFEGSLASKGVSSFQRNKPLLVTTERKDRKQTFWPFPKKSVLCVYTRMCGVCLYSYMCWVSFSQKEKINWPAAPSLLTLTFITEKELFCPLISNRVCEHPPNLPPPPVALGVLLVHCVSFE